MFNGSFELIWRKKMKTVINGGTIIDGTGSPPKEGNIVIADGKISAVGPDTTEAASHDDRVVDARGQYVLPGFINCHVHFSLNAGKHPMNDMAKTDVYTLTIQGVQVAPRLLKAGITTVRDMGSKHFEVLALRNAINSGMVQGPTILAPGQALLMTGGHFSGLEVDGVASCLAGARAQLKAGADFIKVMATGGLGKPDEVPGAQELTAEEIQACFAIAHMAGKPCAAHAHGMEGIKAIVAAGASSVEHGTLLDEETMDAMIEKGIYLVPTFAPYWIMAEEGPQRGIADYMINASKWVMEEKMPRFQKAVKKGVKIAFGTDGGSPVNPHEDLDVECRCMLEGGMSPMEVIVSLTRNAADLLRLGDKLGTLEVGKVADIVLLGGNPLDNIASVSNVNMVLKAGIQV
jgi:imidazolonepropionase-like amidohydrolase